MRGGQLLAWRSRPELLLGWLGTAVVVSAVYAVAVVGGAALSSGYRPPLLVSVLATVAVALVIGPAQRRSERLASRLVHGERTAPYDVLMRFSTQAGGGRDPEELPRQMARLLAEGTGAAWAQVWVVVHGRLVPVASYPEEVPAAVGSPPVVGSPDAGDGLRSVTVAHHGVVLGVLRVQQRPGHPLTPLEERLMSGLAAQAGMALHAAQLRAELVTRRDELSARIGELRRARDQLVATQDDERRRLERDIHDGAQQHLVALSINLRLAQTLAGRTPARARDLLGEQAAAADGALETLRALARGVQPRALTERGLAAAFEQVAGSSPVPVVVTVDSEVRLDPAVEGALYFCGLEAIQNAVKHAAATSVRVDLQLPAGERSTARLTVSDDGTGIGPGADAGSGLANMRERLESLGGSLQIDSRPGSGTCVVAVCPALVGAGVG